LVAQKMLLTLLLLVAAVSANPRVQFEAFKIEANKTYVSLEEEEARFEVFQDNLNRIAKHNSEGHTWTMGVTKFADLTREEFIREYASGRLPTPSGPTVDRRVGLSLADLPDSVDWRDKGVITPVRDQGMCGSCWAFAAASSIASYAQINHKHGQTLKELSPQHLVSCTPNTLHCGGTGGCMGAVPQLAFTYASLFGVVTEDEYPYTSGDPWGEGDDQKCKFDARTTEVSATTMGFRTLPHNDQLALMDHLANRGPISTSVAASDWGLYYGGVFDGCPYDENIAVNHAVQLVGYGTDPENGDYWLIKNSWSTMWGDMLDDAHPENAGYMKLKRESDPPCGTNTTPLDGSACADGGVTSVHVCGMCAILSDNSYPVETKWTK